MPLRDPELIGMTDPRDLTSPPRRVHEPTPAPKQPRHVLADRDTAAEQDELNAALSGRAQPVARPKPAPLAAARPAAPHDGSQNGSSTAEHTPAEVPLSTDLPREFVQILGTPELAVRLGRAAHHLKLELYKARYQQTIMGALIERNIPDPDDPAVIAAMASILARWRQEPLSERRGSRRLGWQLPLEISNRLDQLLLNLKEQHYRLRPSATSLLSALIWFELDPDTPAGQQTLRQLVTPYHQQWEQPDYSLATA